MESIVAPRPWGTCPQTPSGCLKLPAALNPISVHSIPPHTHTHAPVIKGNPYIRHSKRGATPDKVEQCSWSTVIKLRHCGLSLGIVVRRIIGDPEHQTEELNMFLKTLTPNWMLNLPFHFRNWRMTQLFSKLWELVMAEDLRYVNFFFYCAKIYIT